MEKKDRLTGEKKRLTPVEVDNLERGLKKYKVNVPDEEIYDAAYLASMVDADFWGSSITDEEHMFLYIKDVLCDVDGYDGLVFCRFLADCSAKGCPIQWDRML